MPLTSPPISAPAALSLQERAALRNHDPLRDPFSPKARSSVIEDDLFERWRSQAPFDEPQWLHRRLAGDGLDLESFRRLLGTPADEIPPPPPAVAERSPAADLPPTPDLPGNARYLQRFLRLFAPRLRRGVDDLTARAETLVAALDSPPFSPDDVARLFLPSLEARLAMVAGRTLVMELQIARLEDRLEGDSPEARFQSFVDGLGEPEGAEELLAHYPVLERQVDRLVEFWVEAGAELLGRLCDDRGDFAEALGWEPGNRRLVTLDGGQGDAHRRGRTVCILTFDDGARVVYKPRSLGAEGAYGGLLQWLEQNGYPLDFKIPRTLDRGTHGWMEFVEAAPCAEGEQIPRFYRRLGAHLALLHLLGAIDLHFENLIACGEYPVPVDLEPLFHPVLSSDPDDAWRAGSVIGVGLLPERSFRHGEGGGIDVSGIGAEAGQRLARPGLVLRQPGTDRMMFTLGSRGLPEGNHRPRLDGEEVSIQRFADDLAAGFRQLYRFVEGHRMALLAPDGPLSAFAGVETRVIVRSTMPYVRLLFDTYHPDQMRDALERDLVLDRVWGVVRRQPELEPVVRAERRDLEMGDVPYFSTRPDSRSLWTSDGERIPDLLAETGLARARRRLGRTWGPADLERQLATIRASFQMLELTADHEATPSYRLPERAPTASPEALLAAAKRVGDRLADLAFHSADRSTWVALRSMGNHRWSLDPLGVDLFTGLPGVALFLAHLGHAAEDDAYTELAKRAWRQTEALLERHPGQPDAPGAFTGWGGLAYARQYLARLWGRKDLLDGAVATLPDLPALLRSSPHQDLLDGTAGALLALLRLHRDRPLDSVLGLAKACGDQLLSTAQPEDGGLGWPMGGDGGPILSGLSHGASGMAWALAELALVSGDDAYGDAARRAMAFERGLFSEEHRNWADLRQRTRDDPSYMVAWCHGAPGVGIARLACLSLLGGPEIRADLDAALETTLEQGFGKNHCLCHGDLGNLDVLLLAAGRLGDGALARRVERLRDRIVAGIDEGGWRFGMLVPRAETPGLMVGLAGIGHQLLRLAFPDRVPSILALDLPDKGSHSLWTT